MDQIYERVAGLDVHRDNVVACFRRLGPRGGVVFEKDRFATTTAGLQGLEAWLAERQVQLVAMEATACIGSRCTTRSRPASRCGCATRGTCKKVPGRKTDMSDAEWLADVAAHGMVRPSFVPPAPIRELRELTRYRKTQIDARASEVQRLEKVLQDAGIKLSSVASKVRTQSGRAMVEALIAGERDGVKLAELAKGRMRLKIPALAEALTGRFGSHHAVACERILGHLDFLNSSIAALTDQIDARTAAFEPVYALLLPVPGVDRLTVDVIIAETGADMSRFPTPAISRPGSACARAATSRRASAVRSAPPAATSGCAARCSSPAGPRHAPSTATSARNTGRSLAAADRTRRPSPSRTR